MRLLALPMHGEVKMRAEGLRTRDAHLLEWLAALSSVEIEILSRPEPFPRVRFARRSNSQLPSEWKLTSPEPIVIPIVSDRRQWWVKANRYLPPVLEEPDVVAIWNIVGGSSLIRGRSKAAKVWVDLLDDWTIHPLLRSIRPEAERGYRDLFDRAELVTANSEGTMELARRFGRTDALLLPNGVDPQRFQPGPPGAPPDDSIVGYGGKLGSRLDVELIEAVTTELRDVLFQFAGPILERPVGGALKRLPNVELLGDVHYDRYPTLVKSWSVTWVPHRVGRGEVGGDAIKIYEYVAAGKPVVSTAIIGSDRFPQGVHVADASNAVSLLREALVDAGSMIDIASGLDETMTWRHKTLTVMRKLGLPMGPAMVTSG